MITVTERIAKITVSGNETVKFNPVYPVIAVKGTNIKATLIKDAANDATEGIYNTSDGNGYTIIDNHTCKDTLYLSGSGDVKIWGGTDANKCPFKIRGKGGDSITVTPLSISENGTYTAPFSKAYSPVTVDVQEQPWQPLEDGYSNFWFELTDGTLSPWLNFSAKNNDAVIDWGDGSGEQALDTLTPTHTYAKAGKYVVKVKGVTGIERQFNIPLAGKYIQALQHIELNDDVSAIAANAFSYCTGLKDIILPDVAIPNDMCYYCTSITEITVPTGVTQVGSNAFRGCYSLVEIQLPQTLATIGNYALSFNPFLLSVTLPETITSIGSYALTNCVSLSEIHIQATNPPTIGTNVLYALPANYIVYVPVGYGETYKAAAGWSAYADHILEEGQTPNRAMLSRLAKAVETDTDTDTEEKR